MMENRLESSESVVVIDSVKLEKEDCCSITNTVEVKEEVITKMGRVLCSGVSGQAVMFVLFERVMVSESC